MATIQQINLSSTDTQGVLRFPCSSNIVDTIADYLGEKEENLPAKQKEVATTVAQQVFWGLKEDNWWKQIIDGEHHKFGKWVFDLGLHGFHNEPGYYDSCLQAAQFISGDDRIMQNPSLSLYHDLHRIVCSHFKGKTNNTLMSANKTGIFRTTEVHYVPARSGILILPLAERKKIDALFKSLNLEDFDTISDHETNMSEQVEKMNEYIAERSKELGTTKPIAVIKTSGLCDIAVDYTCPIDEIEPAVKKLFADFNQKVANTKDQDQLIESIADLYMMLEWLHPLEDGQGRTDLFLLAKLLCQHGFNPAILEEPFVSTLWPFKAWVNYLKNGMVLWQKEFCTSTITIKRSL